MSETAQPIIYLSMTQDSEGVPAANFEIRTVGPSTAIIPSIKTAVARVAPHASLDFTTLEGQVAESLRLPRTLATLSGFYGGLALLLAMIGLYGIMSYNVARRSNAAGLAREPVGSGERATRRLAGLGLTSFGIHDYGVVAVQVLAA